MTEEQRVRLEELISEFELYVEEVVLASEEGDLRYARSQREKARDRIANHLDLIQWSAATYNLRRGGTSVPDNVFFMDVDNKDEDKAHVGVDLPKCLVESPIEEMSKVGKNLGEILEMWWDEEEK